MPAWKKIIISGSDAALNSLYISNGLIVSGSTNLRGNDNGSLYIDSDLIPTVSFDGTQTVGFTYTINSYSDDIDFDVYYTGESGSYHTELSPVYQHINSGLGPFDGITITTNNGITLSSGSVSTYTIWVNVKTTPETWWSKSGYTLGQIQSGVQITLSGNTSTTLGTATGDLKNAGFATGSNPIPYPNTFRYQVPNPISFIGDTRITGSLYVSNGIYGNLTGSSSYAITASLAFTASYAATSSLSLATTENRIIAINKSGATITKGMVVHLTGSNNSSDTPYIITASYENDTNSANTLGIASQTIPFNSTGYVTTEGVITGINVTGFISGQVLYLGATGSIIGYAPTAPLHAVRLGQVVRDSPSNNGSIYVRIDNGYEIGELHDVSDTTTSGSFGDLLVKSGSIWINSKNLTGSYGITGSLNVSGSSAFKFSSLGTDQFTIDGVGTTRYFVVENSNGFVGIGQGYTTSARPSSSVDIRGNTNIRGLATSTGSIFTVSNISSSVLFTVSSSGFVGINKSTPNANLDISGSVIVSGSGTTDTTTALQIVNKNLSSSLTVFDSNEISINNNTPGLGSQFSVDSYNPNYTRITYRNQTSVKLELGYGITGYGFTHPTGEYIAYGTGLYFGQLTGASPTAFFSTQGNVGIGETTLGARLHIKSSGATSASRTVQVDNSNGTSLFTIRDDGNVGIGVTSPSYKLDISGGVDLIRLRSSSFTTDIYEDTNFHIRRVAGGGILYMNEGWTTAALPGIAAYATNTDFGGNINLYDGKAITTYTGSGVGANGRWDASTGNLSLGKTTANARLDISGSAIISGSLTVTGNIVGVVQGTASHVQGGKQDYIPLWSTNSTLTSSYISQAGNILATSYNGQYRGFYFDYNTDSYILGDTSGLSNTYIQVFDGGDVINVYSPNYTYFNDKVGVSIIPTNPGLAVSGSLEVTGPGTVLLTNTNLQLTGSIKTTGSIQLNTISLTKTSFDTIAAGALINTSCDEPLAQFRNFRSMHIKYNIQDPIGDNYRAGSIIAITNGTGSVQYNETTTMDIGNTTGIILSVIQTNSNNNLTLSVYNTTNNSVDLLTEYTML